MARKASGIALNRINMVAQGTLLKGTLYARGDLLVQGHIIGDVTADAWVIVAPSGVVEGDVAAADADISGTVQGALDVEEQLVLRERGCIEGPIATGQLVVEDGAVFNGRCTMTAIGQPPRQTTTAGTSTASRGAGPLSKWSITRPKPQKTPPRQTPTMPSAVPPRAVEPASTERLPHWAEAIPPPLDLPPAESTSPEPEPAVRPLEDAASVLQEAAMSPPVPSSTLEPVPDGATLSEEATSPIVASLKRLVGFSNTVF